MLEVASGSASDQVGDRRHAATVPPFAKRGAVAASRLPAQGRRRDVDVRLIRDNQRRRRPGGAREARGRGRVDGSLSLEGTLAARARRTGYVPDSSWPERTSAFFPGPYAARDQVEAAMEDLRKRSSVVATPG